ncbi:hypothetical protein K437DRAFT_256623 [Tilletiaria anomala UBC 951]|uniref:Uncharacterized protein n=1 Tax=Tilletiaria anomala (strain ATCC 24038 / CBS 436.72 / UBC 951) TaxID=1037660 RepID=A0A066W2I2_TILAU|nr:uncharacterized protein K437DRAFT_256623 [Tilletiaria anomala UBC 951]KDN45284.1 hypothetical protein K437DRAFT_256623 [Tilletiaria anomala UBC 951]
MLAEFLLLLLLSGTPLPQPRSTAQPSYLEKYTWTPSSSGADEHRALVATRVIASPMLPKSPVSSARAAARLVSSPPRAASPYTLRPVANLASSPAVSRVFSKSISSVRTLPSSSSLKMACPNSRTPTVEGTRQLASIAANSATPASSFLDALPSGYQIQSSSSQGAQYAVFSKDLEKPALDDQSYRLITLANGLEALLIHDPKTDKASAAMDIKVGHLSDPEDVAGLAHYCEHMLFLGTKKYPRENEYSEFLNNHSGSSNAFTALDNTCYFFDVGHAHLEGALDRFAQFFLEPLFDPSCAEREVRAVDSEHKKNLQSDAWRSFQLEKSLSDPSHPYSKFGTGNLKTLWDAPRSKGKSVRDELLKFHDRYYSANVMKLVVIGREDLDTLTNMAISKFSGVKNKGIAPPEFPSSPFSPEQLQTQVFFRSVKDIRLLHVMFPIPDQVPYFRTKPAQFLSHFIGHEGQGSILSHLKNKGWSNRLSAGAADGANGFEFFKISVDLTTEGLAHYDDVIASIFKYIELLRDGSSLQEWAFKEVQQLSELNFRFKEKSPPASYASQLAGQMQINYPREWILSGPYLTRDFNVDLIKDLLKQLTPTKCRVFVAAQQMPDGTQSWDSKEKWYGTEYKLMQLPDKLLEFQQPNAEDLALPGPNSFIPKNFEVPGKEQADKLTPSKQPVMLLNSPTTRLWHKKDDRFWLPKANVFMLLRSPLIDATPNNAVKARLFVELVKDALTEYSYDAELAGLGYNIESHTDGIGLAVDGYNDKLAVLCKYILEAVASFQVDKKRFEILKDQVTRSYQNFQLEAPYQHANYYTTYLLMERMWTAEEKLAELDGLTAEDVQRFIPELLGRLHIEMLAHGNLQREDAIKLKDMAESILKPKALAPAELVSHRSLVLPPATSLSWSKEVAHTENVNSSIEYYCQVGDPMDVSLRTRLLLFAQIASEPCFDQLRTKEQLGYLVFSSARKMVGQCGFRVLVQSERDVAHVESRIDVFFDYLKNVLDKMTQDEFNAHKESLIQSRLEVVKNLGEEASRFWYHIHSRYYDFLQRETDVAALRELTKQDIVDFFMRYIHHSSVTRSKLTVNLRSQVKPTLLSAVAVDALMPELLKFGAEEGDVEALKAQALSVESVTEYVRETIGADNAPLVEQVCAKVAELAKQHPAHSQQVVIPSAPGVKTQVVDDAVLLKSNLAPSKAAVPVKTWTEFAADGSRANL